MVGVAILDQLEGRHAGCDAVARVVEGEGRVLGPEVASDLNRKLELDPEVDVVRERDPGGRAVHPGLEHHTADRLVAPIHRLDGFGGEAHLVAGRRAPPRLCESPVEKALDTIPLVQ